MSREGPEEGGENDLGMACNDYMDRLAELGMETLEEKRHRMVMAQVYKLSGARIK